MHASVKDTGCNGLVLNWNFHINTVLHLISFNAPCKILAVDVSSDWNFHINSVLSLISFSAPQIQGEHKRLS